MECAASVYDGIAMDTFSPEFSQHWISGPAAATDTGAAARRDDDVPSPTQQAALAALADRVSAARSIV
jgi:hypothetical protein